MDDEAETYKLWKIRKTVMQVRKQISSRILTFKLHVFTKQKKFVVFFSS